MNIRQNPGNPAVQPFNIFSLDANGKRKYHATTKHNRKAGKRLQARQNAYERDLAACKNGGRAMTKPGSLQ